MMTTRSPARRARATTAALTAFALLAVAGACGSTAPAGGHPAGGHPAADFSAPANSRALALRDARRLLATVRWPAAWPKPVATIPPRFPSLLRGPALEPFTPDLVDLAEFALVPATPSSVLGWLGSHRPAGSSLGLHGQTSTPRGEEWVLGWSYPAEERLPQRSLLVEVAQDGTRTAVRIDAQVVYRPDKPASEVVPAGVVRVVLLVTPASGPTRRFVVTSPTAIGQLVATVDALKRPSATTNPGGPEISTAEARRQVTVEFFTGHGSQPAAVAVDRPALAALGTGNVSLSVGGRAQPVLEDASGSLVRLVSALTGAGA